MPDRPNFPIPDELTPDTFCLCLQIPNNEIWKQVIAGLLAQPMYWFNWQRDSSHSGKILSQYWQNLFDQIDWSDMSCCCTPPQKRLNADGTMSISTDGGATWQPAGDQDPRNTAMQLPPVPGDDGATKKCKAANSIVRQLKDQQAAYSANIGTISTLAEMAASLVGLAVLVFFDPALAPFLIGAFFELAAALLATTQTAYNALFTDDDWSWVLCEVYCKMDDTGTIPASEFINIQADFDSHFSGNAALTFSSILNAWQLPGLNNAAKIPTTDNLDCSGCCPVCGANWVAYTGYGDPLTFGTDVHGNYVQGTPVLHSGVYYLIIHSPGDDNDCCDLIDVRNTDGTTPTDGGTLYIICGQPKAGTYHNFSGTPVSTNEVQVQRTAATPTRVYLA